MKKFLPLLFLVVLSLVIRAQDCKYLVKEVDKFTKAEKLETIPVVVFNYMKRLDFRFVKLDTEKYLFANVTFPAVDLVFSSGDYMILLFNDESTYTLKLHSERGKTISAGKISGGFSSFGLFYELSHIDIEKLRGKQLSAVRFYANSQYFEFEVAKTAMQFGGAGKAKKEDALKNFFIKDIDCI